METIGGGASARKAADPDVRVLGRGLAFLVEGLALGALAVAR